MPLNIMSQQLKFAKNIIFTITNMETYKLKIIKKKKVY